jgi:hypothetical protein
MGDGGREIDVPLLAFLALDALDFGGIPHGNLLSGLLVILLVIKTSKARKENRQLWQKNKKEGEII